MTISKSLKIALIGSGGREHAIAFKLSQSQHVEKILCIPGNPGIAQLPKVTNININSTDYSQIVNFCKNENVDFVVIGPEQPLKDGLSDMLQANDIKVFGPTKLAAQLETSKSFTKKICSENNIPTAKYETFTQYKEAENYALNSCSFPVVIKQDGLAAGKGVFIANDLSEAKNYLTEAFKNDDKIVIEEFLEGTEISFFALISENNIIPFSSAQDYKKAYDNDEGPNTGGMGTYSPSKLMTDELQAEIIRDIIYPTITALKKMNIIYQGILFAGLMLTKDGPKLIEYNTRFGDPETQSILLRLESDLADIFIRTIEDNFDGFTVEFSENKSVCVIMASKGYPGTFEKNTSLKLPQEISTNTMIFHAGTAKLNNQLVATGGRVLGVSAYAKTINEARLDAYELVKQIDWPNGFCRMDIAKL